MKRKKETEYVANWKKKNCKRINLDLNQTKEADVIEWLYSQYNMTRYIVDLIRKDMKKEKKKLTSENE